MKFTFVKRFALLLSLAAASQASAQYTPTIDIAAPFAMIEMQMSVLRNANARLRRGSTPVHPQPSTVKRNPARLAQPVISGGTLPSAKLRYVPSLARRKVNIERFAANIGRDDPGTAAAFRNHFASTDFFGKLNRALSPLGYSVDNVGDALASWWMGSWLLANQDFSTVSPAKIQAVKLQAAEMVLTTPAFASADDATKQEMAEALWIFVAANEDFIKQAERDPRLAGQVALAARQGALKMGIDLTAMTLTDEGFVMRR